ncbi:MAG: hypothetical protein FWH55_07500 [Oscillospiraceae bacterium]|nr:hypothetical protein [Oscillospiraceae bacterium]
MADRRVDRSREAIKSALISLMKTTPFSKIKATDVIDASKYCRSTFYKYYCDIYDLMNKIIRDESNHFFEIIAGTIRNERKIEIGEGIYKPAYLLMQHVYENQDLYSLLLHNKFPTHNLSVFIQDLSLRFLETVDIATDY